MLGRPRSGEIVTCPQCGKERYRAPSEISKKFCGYACRDAFVRAKRVNDEDGTARCAKCREWKPIEYFVKGGAGRPHSYCKPCSSDWFAERRGVDPEKRKPYEPAFKLTEEQKKANKRERNRMQHQARRAAGKAPSRWEIGKLLCRQDARCAYCRQLLTGEYHIDHKLPVSRGGKNDLENLHLTCPRCNLIKGAMTHEEFLVSKKRRAVAW